MTGNRRNILILFLTQVVVMLGFGLIIPIMPFYVESFGAGGRELGALMAIFAFMQFIFAPYWGQLSDRIGRKPVIMLGMLGNAIAMLFFGLSTQLWMLFASRALAGILSSATMPTAMAYISDSTTERERGGGMGMIGAAMGLGMVIGPGIGGWLAEKSLPMPFFLASAFSMLALLLVLIFLPESLPAEARTRHSLDQRRPSQFRVFWQALLGPIGFLLVLSFLVNFALANFESVFGLYALRRYGYDTKQVGAILTSIGLATAIVQGVLTGPLTRRWGDALVIKAGLIGSAVGFLLLTQATNFVQVLVTTTIFMLFNALLRPTSSSLISKRASVGQGVAMGLNNSAMSLGRIAGPLWAGSLFDAHMNYPYFSGAIAMIVGAVASFLWLPKLHSTDRPTPR